MEEWRDVVGYEGMYQVSNLGNVKSVQRLVWNPGKNCYRTQYSRLLRKIPDRKGYLRVSLSKEGTIHQELIHRLVALAFIPNPNSLPRINHKDECTSNNSVENLEWCDNRYNVNYGSHNLHISQTQSIPILQYDLEGNFIKEWASSREVEKELGYSNVNILRCCNGGFFSKGRNKFVHINSAYGFKWIKKNG